MSHAKAFLLVNGNLRQKLCFFIISDILNFAVVLCQSGQTRLWISDKLHCIWIQGAYVQFYVVIRCPSKLY